MFLNRKVKFWLILGTILLIFLSIVISGCVPRYSNDNSKNIKYGAWIGSWPTEQGLKDFENLQQKHLDVVNMYSDWSMDFTAMKKNFDAVYNNDSIMLFTWEPQGISTLDIKEGSKDEYIRKMAKDIKSYDKSIIIRPLHEGNGNWYSWSIGDSKVNTNETYAAAFRHIVDIFRQEGATNVKWDFNINASNVGVGSSYLNHYPGDNYVDIISIDGYNWGTTKQGSTWQSFDQIFSESYNTIKAKNKPVSIAEFSSAEKGGDKAQWYIDAFNTIKSDKYKLINTVVCFNENKETAWAINSSSAALEGYKQAINSKK